MPDDDLVLIGEELIELSAAFPGCGLDAVGEFARDLGNYLRSTEDGE
jgi:hypothetical protein